MDRNPRSAAERVADDVLHGHICRQARAVVDVRGLAVRRVGSRNVVVVAPQHHGSRNAPVGNGTVEGLGDLRAALAVGIEDAGLRTHDQPVTPGLANPVDVVVQLPPNIPGSRLPNLFQHFGGQRIGRFEVLGKPRGTNPAERPETVIEEHRPHNILYIRRIAETSALAHHRRPGARGFQQEGIAVVEEIHPLGGQLVDGIHLPPQRFLHAFAKAPGFLGHHLVRSLAAQPDRIITACPRVVERSLVRAQINGDLFRSQPFPEVHDIAHISQRYDLFCLDSLSDTGDQFIQCFMQFVDPPLLVAFLRRLGVDLGNNAHHPRNVTRLGLGSRHTAEARRDEQHPARIGAPRREAFARGVHHRDRRAVDDALRPDIHIRSCGHLPILRHSEGVEPLPVVGLRVVGDHHAVGHHHARGVGVRREQPQRMPRVHHQRLAVGHLRQILHCEAVLRPVLEHRAVAAVGDQLVGMLSDLRVEVVLDHQHDGRRLPAAGGILVDGPRIHLVIGTQAVHIDTAVFAQLLGELLRQNGVVLDGEVTQGVFQGQHLLFVQKDILALGRMVDLPVIGFCGGQPVGNTRAYIILEFFACHIIRFSVRRFSVFRPPRAGPRPPGRPPRRRACRPSCGPSVPRR